MRDFSGPDNSLISELYCIYTRPLCSSRMQSKVIFKQSLTDLNLEVSFAKTRCHSKIKEPRLPYYLPITGRRIIGVIPFLRVLVLCEMQIASSNI